MPVYRQTYKQYTGEYLPHSFGWTVIAWKGIQKTWKHPWIKFAKFPFLGLLLLFTGRIFIATNLDIVESLGIQVGNASEVIRVDDLLYLQFLTFQIFFCFILTLITAPNLISVDKRTKALTLYLSKSLTRFDYLFGKGMIPFAYMFTMTAIGGWFLLFMYGVLTDDLFYIVKNSVLATKILVFSGCITLPLVFISLAVSAVSQSRITVSVVLCFIFFLCPVISGILSGLAREFGHYSPLFNRYEWWTLIDLRVIYTQLGAKIFGDPTDFNMHWGVYAVMLFAVCSVCSAILHKNIKAVEVVK